MPTDKQSEPKTVTKQKQCYWCKKFLSDKTKMATAKEPDVFYCPGCYEKGYEMEKEAMGMNDPNYAN